MYNYDENLIHFRHFPIRLPHIMFYSDSSFVDTRIYKKKLTLYVSTYQADKNNWYFMVIKIGHR